MPFWRLPYSQNSTTKFYLDGYHLPRRSFVFPHWIIFAKGTKTKTKKHTKTNGIQ
jgi:hypothetical protein